MSRFNKVKPPVRPAMPLAPAKIATIYTANGAQGFERDAKGELFTLAVANFVSQDSFYETGKARDERFTKLIHQVAVEDAKWLTHFLKWLRNDANMRTASIVGALEAAAAMVRAKIPGGRQLIASVLIRADEPGEAIGYWFQTYGRKLPKPVKRGIADAATRLYNERALLKYDTESHGFRFGDVIDLVHPCADSGSWQGQLFKLALERRHGREDLSTAGLRMVEANIALRTAARERPEVLLDDAKLRLAGMTWEDVLSLAGQKLDKKLVWQSIIPSMGYMGLLRNLRNLEQAGISRDMVDIVSARLRDPAQVASSRQLPMRFLSAYNATTSSQFLQPLEEALEHSLATIPEFGGRTLVLVDTSGSMDQGFSKDGTLRRWDAAALFGLALARRCQNADVYSFSNRPMKFAMQPGMSTLRALQAWKSGGYFQGGGTDTKTAIDTTFKGHDRIVVLTDEQANAHNGYSWGRVVEQGVFSSVPAKTMCFTFNLAGDKAAHAAGSPTRVTVAGLSDQGFKMMHMLEGQTRHAGKWPWEV